MQDAGHVILTDGIQGLVLLTEEQKKTVGKASAEKTSQKSATESKSASRASRTDQGTVYMTAFMLGL